jgi:lipopolysaccharide transport system permease protein
VSGVTIEPSGTTVDDPAPSIAPHEKLETVIEGGRQRLSWASVAEIWEYREVLWAFAVRRVKVRYKQAAFGIGWAVLQPLLSALLFAVFIGHVAKVGGEGVPYFTFALTGMTIWTFFSSTFSSAVNSLVAEAFILRKSYFPREVLPLSTVIAGGVDLAAPLVIALIATVATTRGPSLTWLALPIPLLLAAFAAVAFGIGLSALNLYYRDVGYVMGFVLQIGLFVSPVVYSLTKIPSGWRLPYAVFNPAASSINDLRRILLHGQWPRWGPTGLSFLWTIVVFIVGYVVFKRLERSFADRV